LQERKGLALLQRRRGPNVIGYLGILQPIADALKLLTKEFILPTQSNYFLFTAAPIISMLCAFIG
jgi:NADH:ubiquinone oxidoreductase subunit H